MARRCSSSRRESRGGSKTHLVSPMSASVPDSQNRWIWPFELLEKLGEGGMGVVYRARYVKNDKQVAVKILPSDVNDPTILGRFDRELEILRKLRHPNIVHCFGGATEGKDRYYAMEIVDGGGLDKLISRRGQLPWEMVVKYAQQMAAALEHAHQHGVTHRDVKPGNFLIGSSGQLKLSDFGLATFASARNLTAAGKTMGTFRYMAPEQIRGKEVGPQTDLYSLGCVLYEMLTGRAPFDGATPAEILDQHLHKEAPRASATAFDCPASLDKLISMLLQKDPARRPVSATQVLESLAQISPVVMVNTSPVQDARTTAEVPVMQPRPEFSFWKIPVWAVIAMIVVPLLWLGWTLSLQSRVREAEESRTLLLQMWRESEGVFKDRAAEALGQLARRNPDVLEDLRAALKSENEPSKLSALKGVAAAGPAAINLHEDVYKLQQRDESTAVRLQAQQTLTALKSGDRPGGNWHVVLLSIAGVVMLAVYFVLRRIKAPR